MVDKELLIELLKQGKTHRDIAPILGVSRSTVGYYIDRLDLKHLSINQRNLPFRFEKIDSKEKAYVLGFILADGSIQESNDVEISCQIKDQKVVEYIGSIINANPRYDYTIDRKTRRFPRARIVKRIKDITKFTGGRKKKERHYPRVGKAFERYLLLGLFDGDGCITWGNRKKDGRLWHKFTITSSYKILEGVQIMLYKELGISSTVRKKSNEDCYVLTVSRRTDILTLINYLYCDDFIVLDRKYFKSNALRLELEENGGTTTS